MPSTAPERLACTGERAVHVMAAVLRDAAGRVLIQKRPPGKVAAGLWEFPGGKVDAGESRFAALQRELREELGLDAEAGRPLIRIRHVYTHAEVDLDVWEVARFKGHAVGLEGQEVRWVMPSDLPDYTYPAANLPVVAAARLPDHMMVTPADARAVAIRDMVKQALSGGVRLVQLRAHHLDDPVYEALARELLATCHAHGAMLLLNRGPEMLGRVPADGLHLTGARLQGAQQRLVAEGFWLSASVHDASGLAHAARIGVDFVSLGPVSETASHPDQPAIGWDSFARMVREARLPVYAQGGMDAECLVQARDCGAQGVAGIRMFLPAASTR